MSESQPEALTAFLTAAEYAILQAPHGSDQEASVRLLLAVEVVLALAGKLEPQAPAASALEEDRMWIRQECAGMIREAISRALLGEVPGTASGTNRLTED